MNLKATFLILCVLGVTLPLSQFIPWILDHGFNIPLFIQELFSTRIGGFFGMDVIVSAIVLCLFIITESRRLAIPHRWISILATVSIGVSFGLPLFLYMRQRTLDNTH